jgi:hypothetical protein
MKRARVIIALVCVVGAALLPAIGAVLQLIAMPDWYRPRDDPISSFERRFIVARDALRSEERIGYLPPQALDPKARRGHLYMTRYTLAPTHIRDTATRQLVLADLVADPTKLPANYRVKRDFGGGLLLLERSDK